MSHQAKIFARVFDFTGTTAQPGGTMVFTVEWKRLDGDRKGGKVKFTVDDISTDDKLRADLRELLAAHLSTHYAPEVIRPRHIVGYSV